MIFWGDKIIRVIKTKYKTDKVMKMRYTLLVIAMLISFICLYSYSIL